MPSQSIVLGAISILVFWALAPKCDADCPTNFLQLHNKCYYFSNDIESWTHAHFSCGSLNATLVTLKSKHNDKRLSQYLRKNNLETKSWWIGARYDWMKKRWEWGADGKPVKFDHFARKTVNRTKLDWHCAFLDHHRQYQWNAEPCQRKKYFICMQNDVEQQDVVDDNDNEIPVIVSRKTFEADRRNEAAFVAAPTSPGKPKGNPPLKRLQQKYVCPRGYGKVRRACYKFSRSKATWQNAYFTCAGEPHANSTLAIIPDKKFDRAIRRYAARIREDVEERWIGGIYDWQQTAWKWAANGIIIQHKETDRDILRWHCLIWSPQHTDMWTSDSCVIEKYFICQAPPQVFVRMEADHPGMKVKGASIKHKFDFVTYLEFRRNATHRGQRAQYKQST